MRWLDTPPVWLILALALAWAIGRLTPGLALPGDWSGLAGAAFLVAGVGLMLAGVLELRRSGTTVVPGEDPTALVTSGVFRYSRNPIYLGDVLVLTGAILLMKSVAALVLVPAFAWLLATRYIAPEERRLDAAFGEEFRRWRADTRRWI